MVFLNHHSLLNKQNVRPKIPHLVNNQRIYPVIYPAIDRRDTINEKFILKMMSEVMSSESIRLLIGSLFLLIPIDCGINWFDLAPSKSGWPRERKEERKKERKKVRKRERKRERPNWVAAWPLSHGATGPNRVVAVAPTAYCPFNSEMITSE